MILTENSDGEVELTKIDDITNTEAAKDVVFPHQEVEALKNEDVNVVNEDSNEVVNSSTSTTTTTTSTLRSSDIADEKRLYSGTYKPTYNYF